ncbi:MAG: FAD binding domain-containing protein [Acidobacteriota bacterium]|nr:FAD binding domain-containing protein [Acidobacteriota bacterium]
MTGIAFILNHREVVSSLPPGSILLDYIRIHSRLIGTKIGCREGDCGACNILVGEPHGEGIRYRSMTSCLMPLANAHGKHIVTIEGLNRKDPTPVQRAMIEHGATQCGFCTVGFVVSLVGFCLGEKKPDEARAIASVDGNICRCTGYKSIERAAAAIAGELAELGEENRLERLVENGYLPDYFQTIPERLRALREKSAQPDVAKQAYIVGGGTDLYVQRPEEMSERRDRYIFDNPRLREVKQVDDEISVGAAATVTDLWESTEFAASFPSLDRAMKLVSSTPIRNMATIGGNLVNASPIGDMTIFFLALESRLDLLQQDEKRTIRLADFYKGYKLLDLGPGEIVESLRFRISDEKDLFNFEKVCKRTHLDIASVNTAVRMRVVDGVIRKAVFSAGGVSPVPMVLNKASALTAGRKPGHALIEEVTAAAENEISPISDARGSAEYKRLLLKQLITAHFLELFPQLCPVEANV